MANYISGNNINVVSLSSTILSQNYYPVRNILSKIPPVYQTEELTKFFNSAVNYWFTPGNAETYNGYIGQLTDWYDPSTDNYITEPSSERQYYQLDPAITVTNSTNNVTQAITYTDIINSLRMEGVNVINQDRLFSNNYWSWCPPIDIDKFINYKNYYWVTDIDNYFVLTGEQVKFYVKTDQLPDIQGYTSVSNINTTIPLTSTNFSIERNGNIIPSALYTVKDNVVTFNFDLSIGDKIVVIYQSNINSDIIGKQSISPSSFGLSQFNNGMQVKILNDIDYAFNGNIYTVEGVGSSVSLSKVSEPIEILGQSTTFSVSDDNLYLIPESAYVSGMTKSNIKIFIDNILLPEEYYSYDGIYKIDITVPLNSSSSITIYTPSNISEYFDEYVTVLYGINLKRNQLINITNDINKEYDGLYSIEYNSNLLSFSEYSALYNKDYMTIHRGVDNPWSLVNRWIHKDNINVTIDSTYQATRPIIEFFNTIELYNYGSYRRLAVDFINTQQTDLSNLSGTVVGFIDGTRIDKEYITTNGGSIRLLITNDISSDYKNKIVTIYITSSDTISVMTDNDGINQNGIPQTGEITKVLNGTTYADTEFWFNGSEWVEAQAKGTYPLFNVYNESNVLQGSSSIFTYLVGSGTNDTVLGFPLSYNADGNIEFSNSLNTGTTLLFYSNDSVLENSWYKSDKVLRQKLYNRYTFDGVQSSIELACGTYSAIDIKYINTSLTYAPYVSTLSTSDYSVSGTTLTLTFTPNDGDMLIVETVCFDDPSFGFYEIPSALKTNTDNEILTEISYNECLNQFNSIINASDWLTTSHDYTNGTDIILQTSDMMILGLLTTDPGIDFINSTEYVKSEYTKYKNNFQKLTYDYVNNSKFKTSGTISENCQTIMSIMAQGKSKSSPFYNTGIGKTSTYTQETYIPLTPSMEGLYPVFLPSIVEDRSLPIKANGCYQTFIKGHDGSLTLTFGDYTISNSVITNVNYSEVDYIILELENRIYNSISSSFIGTRPTSDFIEYRKGYFRDSIYSISEYDLALKPFFEKWCSKNGLDYKTNDNKTTNANMDNPFGWNWSHYTDSNGDMLDGSYKGIYEYFYDTTTPHTTPWEMLGFTIMPSWWTSVYGAAPYTSNNYKMWSDISNGYVQQGSRKGIQDLYVRSGLLDLIPVDEFGDLLSPASIGLVKQFVSLPSGNVALGNKAIDGWNSDWSFGDIGPVESMWRNSSEYPFSVVEAFYKLKPGSVINDLWDTSTTSNIFISRLPHSEIYVDGEIIGDDYITKTGINAWISSYLKSKGKNVTTYLGEKIRSLGVNLTHRMAGFTKSDALTVYSDVYGDIPSENIHTILHKGNISNPVYSGIYIVYNSNKYQIYGFDKTNAYFEYYDVDQNSGYTNVKSTNTSSPTYLSWTKNTYYNENTIIVYKGQWYICNKSHTSSSIFEDVFWTTTSKPNVNDSIYGKWYDTIDTSTKTITYGDSLSTIQDVIDFMNGLQSYYSDNGWSFVDYTFNDMAAQFMSWANMNQYDGAFIALSPFQDSAVYDLNSGIVDELVYPNFEMYDIYGNLLTDFTEERSQTELTISASGIYYCRISVSVLEHIVVFDNETIYGDKLYSPEINVSQQRLLINGFKTTNWNGTMNAPGFIVTGNTIVPNFEKTVDNFRKYFDIETVDANDIQEYARKNIGYAKKDYLTNLLVGDTNQFEFYQGMIKQKGTEESFSKLLRSSAISNNNNIQFSEEWAIRLGRYGATDSYKTIELSLSDTDITFDPQIVSFNTKFVDNSYSFSQNFENNNQIVISNDSTDAELMTTSTITPSSLPTNTTTVSLGSITTTDITLSVTSIDSGTGVVTIKIDDTVIIEQYPLTSINSYTIDKVMTGSKLYVTFINNINGKINLNINGYSNVIPAISNSTQYLNINDVYDTSRNILIDRDSHWLWRYDIGEEIVWDKTISKPSMPTAGYVNVDNVNYYANTNSDLLDMYQTVMDSTPSTAIEYSNTFVYDGTSSTPTNTTTRIVPSINEKGYSRLNTINVNLTNALPNNGVVFVIRTSTETLATITSNNLSVGDNIYRPYKFLSLDNTQNSIFIDMQYQGLNSIGYDISGITITVETEIFGVGSMQPSQTTWVYNDNGNWNTYKFQDTQLEIREVFVPSWTGQGSIVALGSTPVDINTGDNVVISSSRSTSTNGDLDQFGYECFNIKTSNTRILNISSNATGSYSLIQELADAGMVIDSITVNNTIALDSTLTPTIITIGTSDDNESIINGVVPSSTFTESNVMLYCDCLCSNTETTPPTEGTSVLTSTSCFDSNGIINVDISNSTITMGDNNTIIPIQVTRTGDIFNTVTSATVTDGGTGYTEVPTVTVNGASGYTATATVANGSVTSISITNSGGCSLPLDTTPTISITGGNGTGATATANVTNVADVPTVVGWQYKDVTASGDYIVGGTLTFPVIDDSTGNDFWSQMIEFTIPSFSSLSNQYEIEIYDINDLGFTINNESTTITVYNTKSNDNSYDLSTTGSKSFNVGEAQTNDNLTVYITNDGKTNVDCNIIVTVNYHYTQGFEIYNSGNAFVISYPSYGGSLMKWKKTRSNTLSSLVTPDGGWSTGDYAHIDNNGSWIVYEYSNNSWVEYFSKVSNYIDNSILRSVTLFTDNDNLTERFNVFDPLQNLIPGNIETNVDYQSKINPAKYNSTNTNEKHYWSYSQVGKTWWDLSTTFFVDYTLYGIDYTRDHWGEVVPDCDVKVYEWVRSPVSPTDWTSYISSGVYNYNGFDTNPSGFVDNDNIPYTLTSEWNSDINGYQETYYFWVYGKSTLPQVKNRKMTCSQITNYIKNIKTMNEAYCALTYDNQLIIGNINKKIKSENSVLKVEWYSDDIVDTDTIHSEWKLIREEDTINKIEGFIWDKFVSSIVGYKNIQSYEIHNGKTLTAIEGDTTSVILSNTDGLPLSGDIKIGNYWFSYDSISGQTIDGFSNPSNVKLDIGQITYSKNVISSEIQVPDQSLTSFEQYGVQDTPLQSMVPNVDDIPSRVVRQTLINEINSILLSTNYVDNISNWNLVFGEAQSLPNIYSQVVSSISDLEGLTSTIGELVLVSAGTSTNDMWILFEYNPYDGSANEYGYTVNEGQQWNINQGFIWNYVDWYATGWSSSNTPQYTFSTMSEKNSATIPDNTLLNGTLVQINQISNNDDRWTWQVYKDDIWTTVAIENGTIELTDIFYDNSLVLTNDNYTVDNILLRDGSFELRFLLNNLDLILTTQQMNEIFFATLRSILNETDQYNDWLIKTSYMYIDGYQEQMIVSEVKKESQFDNLINYIDEVKPYHVKIRDYLIQYVPEQEDLNCNITDFDFPSNNGDILYPETIKGTLGFTYNNSDDTKTVSNTIPWSNWYNNYTNTVKDITEWDADWNGVRRFNTSIYINNIGYNPYGWDTASNPWDYNIEVYSTGIDISDIETIKENYTIDTSDITVVSRYYDLNTLLLDSSFDKSNLVYVTLKNKYYFFNGSNWIEVTAGPWDKASNHSAYDRIVSMYEPTSTMNKDIPSLIGSNYKGDTLFGGNFDEGSFGEYSFDWYGGFGDENNYYTGDTDDLASTDSKDLYSGYINIGTTPYLSRDIDIVAPELDYYAIDIDSADGTGFGLDDIITWGSWFRDPDIAEGNTSELVTLTVTSNIIMRIIDTDSSITFVKDYNDIWYVENSTNVESNNIKADIMYNTGYSTIQTIELTDPSQLYLTFNIDQTNIVEVKSDVVLYDGENYIQYGSDIAYIIPTISVSGKVSKSNNIFGVYTSNYNSSSALFNSKSLYWIGNEIISAEYNSLDSNGDSTLYKINRYLMGTPIPEISKKSYNAISNTTVVFDTTDTIKPCNFDVTFDPKNNVGGYFKTDNGIGLYGITLVEI